LDHLVHLFIADQRQKGCVGAGRVGIVRGVVVAIYSPEGFFGFACYCTGSDVVSERGVILSKFGSLKVLSILYL
jgi:hypothetical protein